jgi:hypothetical protein
LLILIAFIAWEFPEGATFPEIKPFESLAAKFYTLWYSSDMKKQWQSNVVFHAYYTQLRNDIQYTPCITPNTLHRFRPLMKFNADHHFTYITTRADEQKQQLQSYYMLTEDDLEEITKEWSTDLLVAADPVEMSDVDSPEAMTDTPGTHKTKKEVEVQYIHNTSTKTSLLSPAKGGDDEELGGTKVEQRKGEVTPPRDEADPSKKRKITPPRPSSRNKTKAARTTLKTTLTSDDFEFLIATLNDVSLELAEKKEAKQEELFFHITGEFKEAQQALQSSQEVSMEPLTMEILGTGDDPTQLRQIAEKVEAHLRRSQEDIVKATQALVQEQSAHEEKWIKAEHEQLDLQAKWEEEKSQLQ